MNPSTPKPPVKEPWAPGYSHRLVDYSIAPAPPMTFWEVDPIPPTTEEEIEAERINKALEGWPWSNAPPRLLMIAPYEFNEWNMGTKFTLPTYNNIQSVPLFTKCMENDVVRRTIAKFAFQTHDTTWKFAATCKDAHYIIMRGLETWDMTGYKREEGAWCHNCENPRFGPRASQESAYQGHVADKVVVTPFRRQTLNGQSEKPSYEEQVLSLRKMCLGMYNFADFFVNLQFHRVPFLTHHILELVIPGMRKLEFLGVYQCQLINVGHATPLLELIRKDKLKGRENQVDLDFAPMYHQGPIQVQGKYVYAGRYCGAWDDCMVTESHLAYWALILQAIRRARKYHIDFESKEKAFRQFIDKLPLWRIEETLGVILDPMSSNVDIAVMADFRSTLGAEKQLAKRYRTGNTIDWAIQTYNCAGCLNDLPSIFFHFGHVRNLGTPLMQTANGLYCFGCVFKRKLNRESDHYKDKKRHIIQKWLYNEEEKVWNKDNLPQALADFITTGVQQKAQRLDLKSSYYKLVHGYDKEYEERQRPFTRQELHGRRGAFLRDREYWEEMNRQTAYDDPRRHQWVWMRSDRYDGLTYCY